MSRSRHESISGDRMPEIVMIRRLVNMYHIGTQRTTATISRANPTANSILVLSEKETLSQDASNTDSVSNKAPTTASTGADSKTGRHKEGLTASRTISLPATTFSGGRAMAARTSAAGVVGASDIVVEYRDSRGDLGLSIHESIRHTASGSVCRQAKLANRLHNEFTVPPRCSLEITMSADQPLGQLPVLQECIDGRSCLVLGFFGKWRENRNCFW